MPVRDARIDHGDAHALAGKTELLTCQGCAGSLAGSFERRERGAVEHHAVDARICGYAGKFGVVHFGNLAVVAESSSGGGSFSEHSRVKVHVTLELHDDARAAGQLPGTRPKELVQAVAMSV